MDVAIAPLAEGEPYWSASLRVANEALARVNDLIERPIIEQKELPVYMAYAQTVATLAGADMLGTLIDYLRSREA